MQHLHLPTPDFFAPKQEDIQALGFQNAAWKHGFTQLCLTFQLAFFPGCGSVHHAICQQRREGGVKLGLWYQSHYLAAWGISFCPNMDTRSGFLRRSPISLHGGIGVYVHCNGGKGRSAVCVICYLARILAAVWFEGVGVSGDKTVQGNTTTAMAMEPQSCDSGWR